MTNKTDHSIRIILNGEEKFVGKNMTIQNLILDLELDLEKIAIEKNYEIILPEDFAKNILSEGDRIEIVHFIGGG
jgi:thiamine biosynthesis protein ThiS